MLGWGEVVGGTLQVRVNKAQVYNIMVMAERTDTQAKADLMNFQTNILKKTMIQHLLLLTKQKNLKINLAMPLSKH